MMRLLLTHVPPASESQAFDTVRQVEALVKGELPPGAVNAGRWTRRP
jgi:D-3-phosphoglycerate dehydrogenase